MNEKDTESLLDGAAKIYGLAITKMRNVVKQIQELRNSRKTVPARKVWQLGDAIFELQNNLQRSSLQIDGLYEHLTRDLGVKRKWLEKVIILRRYLPCQDLIPSSLNWGQLEKGTRKKAESLRKKPC
ncbi:MAG: hypothetical protein ACTSXC_08580 [Candidatus Freyarchaeota archaeon]